MSNSGSPPKITYPCDYPIKIIGKHTDDFQESVISIVKQYDKTHDGCSEIQESKEGNYTSVKCTIRATSEAQIQQLFEALKGSGRVQVVL